MTSAAGAGIDDLAAEVGVRREGATVHLRLQRPDKLNALTAAMYEDLTAALTQADDDLGVHAVVLSGAGRAFCAGNDLADFVAAPDHRTPVAAGDLPATRFLHALAGARVAVVAAVHGHCVGIGATMLLHCDLVVADPSAVLSFPFTALGLVPEAASSLLLPAVAGFPLASRLLLLGDALPAADALAAGLVTAVVAAGEHVEAAEAFAARLAALPRESLRLTKGLVRAPAEGVAARLDREAELFVDRLSGEDFARLVASKRS